MIKDKKKRESYKKKIKIWERKHPIMTAFLVASAIILFWRGIWILSDHYLFPTDPTLSALASIVIGFFILYLRDFELKELLEE